MDINQLLKEQLSDFTEDEKKILELLYQEINKDFNSHSDIEHSILRKIDEIMGGNQ